MMNHALAGPKGEGAVNTAAVLYGAGNEENGYKFVTLIVPHPPVTSESLTLEAVSLNVAVIKPLTKDIRFPWASRLLMQMIYSPTCGWNMASTPKSAFVFLRVG